MVEMIYTEDRAETYQILLWHFLFECKQIEVINSVPHCSSTEVNNQKTMRFDILWCRQAEKAADFDSAIGSSNLSTTTRDLQF